MTSLNIGARVRVRVDLGEWATLTGPLIQDQHGTIEEIQSCRHVGGVPVPIAPRFFVRLDKPIEPVPGWPSEGFWFDAAELRPHWCSREMDGSCHECGAPVPE